MRADKRRRSRSVLTSLHQRPHEDYHAEEAQERLGYCRGHVADQYPAGRAGGTSPVPAFGLRQARFSGCFSLSPPEVLSEEDAADAAEYQAEEGSDAEEKRPDKGAADTADGAAHGAPVACPKPARSVGGGDEVGDECDGREESEQDDYRNADVLEFGERGIDEGGEEDQGHPWQAG